MALSHRSRVSLLLSIASLLAIIGALILVALSHASATHAAGLRSASSPKGVPAKLVKLGTQPPTDAQCLATIQIHCYSPQQIRTAYNVDQLINKGYTGKGQTIVIIDSLTEGVQGLPEFLYLEQYALDHHLGKIFSQGWGATENTLFTHAGRQVIASFERLYLRAALDHVTVFASPGDSGSANVELDGTTYYPFPTVGFPASSPLVTAVGGTSLSADSNGKYQSETVWNDGYGAGGGGISQVFKEPFYQRSNLPHSVQKVLGNQRGIPDFALYELGNNWRAGDSFHDITVGNNEFVPGVPGYNATPGWDLATGWGTPQTKTLVKNLIQLTDQDNGDSQVSSQRW